MGTMESIDELKKRMQKTEQYMSMKLPRSFSMTLDEIFKSTSSDHSANKSLHSDREQARDR